LIHILVQKSIKNLEQELLKYFLLTKNVSAMVDELLYEDPHEEQKRNECKKRMEICERGLAMLREVSLSPEVIRAEGCGLRMLTKKEKKKIYGERKDKGVVMDDGDDGDDNKWDDDYDDVDGIGGYGKDYWEKYIIDGKPPELPIYPTSSVSRHKEITVVLNDFSNNNNNNNNNKQNINISLSQSPTLTKLDDSLTTDSLDGFELISSSDCYNESQQKDMYAAVGKKNLRDVPSPPPSQSLDDSDIFILMEGIVGEIVKKKTCPLCRSKLKEKFSFNLQNSGKGVHIYSCSNKDYILWDKLNERFYDVRMKNMDDPNNYEEIKVRYLRINAHAHNVSFIPNPLMTTPMGGGYSEPTNQPLTDGKAVANRKK
jgi:hypothetical protein